MTREAGADGNYAEALTLLTQVAALALSGHIPSGRNSTRESVGRRRSFTPTGGRRSSRRSQHQTAAQRVRQAHQRTRRLI